MQRIPLTCQCCDLPFAEVRIDERLGNVLLIQSRHFGDKHQNTITLDRLLALLGQGPCPPVDAPGRHAAADVLP